MEEKMKSVNASTKTTTGKKLTIVNCLFTFVSLGTVVSGAWACFASVGVGVSLVLVGTIVFSELGF
jgi:hypothetical protein